MIFRLFLIGALVAMMSEGIAQVSSVDFSNDQRIELRLFNNDNSKSAYDGSPYVYEKFQKAKVNDIDKIYFVRYNVADDQMQIRTTADGPITIIDNSTVKYSIKFLESQKKYNTIVNKNGSRGYAVLIWQNIYGAELYKKEIINFYRAIEARNGYQTSKKARYERKDDEFYIKLEGENEVISVPDSKNKLQKLFPEKDLKKFINDNNYSFDNEEHLIKIIQFALDN